MLNYEFKKIKDTYILRLNKGGRNNPINKRFLQ